MKSHISKVRIAALAVGLAIVMSSCGIQNQAGDSSSASGKTKNFALATDGTCWDSVDAWIDEVVALENAIFAELGDFPFDLVWNGPGAGFSSAEDPKYAEFVAANFRRFEPSKDGNVWNEEIRNGEPCPAGTQSASTVNVRSCLPQALIDSSIAGFTEQLNKTDYPADWSQAMIDNYKAEMQRGIDALKGTCVSK